MIASVSPLLKCQWLLPIKEGWRSSKVGFLVWRNNMTFKFYGCVYPFLFGVSEETPRNAEPVRFLLDFKVMRRLLANRCRMYRGNCFYSDPRFATARVILGRNFCPFRLGQNQSCQDSLSESSHQLLPKNQSHLTIHSFIWKEDDFNFRPESAEQDHLFCRVHPGGLSLENPRLLRAGSPKELGVTKRFHLDRCVQLQFFGHGGTEYE